MEGKQKEKYGSAEHEIGLKFSTVCFFKFFILRYLDLFVDEN